MPATRLSPAALCITGSALLCLLSVLSRLLPIESAIDLPIRNPYYPVGSFHIALGFAVLLILFAGVYSSFPLLTGQGLNRRLSRMHLVLTFVEACILILVVQIPPILSQHNTTIVLLLACVVIVVAQAFFVLNLVWSVFKRSSATAVAPGSP